MSKIKSKDTNPELIVRSFLHKLGFRFRLHNKNLPGTPDIILSKYQTVIFVHGCFWHRHKGCKYAYMPKTRIEFWDHKFQKNKKRDVNNRNRLIESGWDVITVWECEVKKETDLTKSLTVLLRKKNGVP